jgi:gliding motility-associated transport system ATP-binding protein
MTDPLVLALDRVNRDLAGRRVVRDLTLALAKGQVLGLLGVNGAGKSTTLRMIAGVLAPSGGRVLIDGDDLGENSGLARRRIGYLPEVPPLHAELTVREFLAFCARLHGLARDADAAVARAIDRCGLGEVRRRLIGALSKGFRQRVGLAQAILHEPDLLVLDEPFSGLDPLWRARFKEVLALERRRGATLFFSSHILGDIEELCDHYGVIDHGRVLEQGRLADLIGSAPLELTGSGPLPDGAATLADGTWKLAFAESERAARLAALPPGAQVVRLERHRLALEDWFVARVRAFHGAGAKLEARS